MKAFGPAWEGNQEVLGVRGGMLRWQFLIDVLDNIVHRSQETTRTGGIVPYSPGLNFQSALNRVDFVIGIGHKGEWI